MKECYNYKKLNSHTTLQCFACHHLCTIKEQEVGKCGVRQNQGGVLYSLVYGRAIAANVDPVEKKPLYHFLPGSHTYSIGTLGCNFQCLNCQNYDISQMGDLKGEVASYDYFNWGYRLSPEEVVEQAKHFNCQSISYTYNEPTIFLEYALDTMKVAQEKSLKNIWVTNGFMTDQTLDLIVPYLDAVNIDLKSYQNGFYEKYCGARLAPILANCKQLKRRGVWLEVTTLIIPGLTDNEEMLTSLAVFIKNELGADTPWHVSAFSGAASWRLSYIPDTPPTTVKRAKELGEGLGLTHVHAGNI